MKRRGKTTGYNCNFDEELYLRLKARARFEKRSIISLIQEAVRRDLDQAHDVSVANADPRNSAAFSRYMQPGEVPQEQQVGETVADSIRRGLEQAIEYVRKD